MNRVMIPIVALCLAVVFLGGCTAATFSPVTGWVFTMVEGPITATAFPKSTRRGESCAYSILGLVALGDASIDAAKRAGQIQEVSSVDHESFSILLVYASYCTVVRGT